jgi:hypothetical protein
MLIVSHAKMPIFVLTWIHPPRRGSSGDTVASAKISDSSIPEKSKRLIRMGNECFRILIIVFTTKQVLL